jgi:glycosyltransferase involved in cell wall biosynthesis
VTIAPDVSVVMAVYNGGNTLLPTIESVLAQTGVSFEFIIVDDGSTDGTGASLDKIAEDSPAR